MRLRTARILMGFAALQLAAPLIPPLQAVHAQDQSELDRFFQSAYSYCDADVLSKHWGQDVSEAKARIGRKIGWGDEEILNEMLDEARLKGVESGVTACYYWQDDRYGYDDAERLASAWRIPVMQAKAEIGYKIALGMEGNLSGLIGAPDKAPAQGSDDQAALEAFASSNFRYCDAELLAESWGSDVVDVKVLVGHKILAGRAQTFVDEIQEEALKDHDARACYFAASHYTYDDASRLAEAWGLADAWDGKLAIGTKLALGNTEALRDLLGH